MFAPTNNLNGNLFVEPANELLWSSSATSENSKPNESNVLTGTPRPSFDLISKELLFDIYAISNDGGTAGDSGGEGSPPQEVQAPRRNRPQKRHRSPIPRQHNGRTEASPSIAPLIAPDETPPFTRMGLSHQTSEDRLHECHLAMQAIGKAPIRDTPAGPSRAPFDAMKAHLGKREHGVTFDCSVDNHGRRMQKDVVMTRFVTPLMDRGEVIGHDESDVVSTWSDDSDSWIDLKEIPGLDGRLAEVNVLMDNYARMQDITKNANRERAAMNEEEAAICNGAEEGGDTEPKQASAHEMEHHFSFMTPATSAHTWTNPSSGSAQTGSSQGHGGRPTSNPLHRTWWRNKFGNARRDQERGHVEVPAGENESFSLGAEANTGVEKSDLQRRECSVASQRSTASSGHTPQDLPHKMEEGISHKPFRSTWWKQTWGRLRRSQFAKTVAGRRNQDADGSADEAEWLELDEARPASPAPVNNRSESKTGVAIKNTPPFTHSMLRPEPYIPRSRSEGSFVQCAESTADESDNSLSEDAKLAKYCDEFATASPAEPKLSEITAASSIEAVSVSLPQNCQCKTDTEHMKCPIEKRDSSQPQGHVNQKRARAGLWSGIFGGSRKQK